MLKDGEKAEIVNIGLVSEDLKSSVENYTKKVSKYPHYTQQEENMLAKAAAEGDFEARRKLIQGNLHLVVAIARKCIHKSNIPFSDLVQEGNMGLIYAINKFNWKYGYRFSTYAAWWIRQAMFKAISEQSFCVKIPVYIQETVSKYNKIKREMENKNNAEVKNADIAKKMNISENKIDAYLNAYTQSLSLDAQFELSNGSSVQLSDTIADERQDVCSYLENEELKRDLQSIIESLKGREQSVIAWRYGLHNIQKRTLEEIGKHYGVTKECIRQTELRAIKKLQQAEAQKHLLKEYVFNN